MRTLRIAVLHPSDELYGADKVVLEVGRALTSSDVTVILPVDVDFGDRPLSKLLAASGIKVFQGRLSVLRRSKLNPSGMFSVIRDAFRTYRIIRSLNPDVIYFNTVATLPVLIFWPLLRRPKVVHVHENLRGVEKFAFNLGLLLVDRILCVSTSVQQCLWEKNRRRSIVIYNGFDIPRGEMDSGPEASGQVFDSDERTTLLVASRWNSWKGHQPLLEALRLSGRRDVLLRIAGGPPPSGLRVDVRELVRINGLDDQCIFLGEIADVFEWIDRSDFVVVPSTEPDPLPTIAIEALGRGTAVIASDSGGLPEIVGGLPGCRLVAPGDVVAWADELRNIDRCQSKDSAAIRDRFESRFSVTAFRESIVREIELLRAGGR